MDKRDGIFRRRMLGASVAAGGLVMLGAAGPLLAQKLRRTPPQILGPYYPITKPLDQDADLTLVKGRAERAAGQVIEVAGRVLNAHGQPLPGVRIEIWQANTHGRYTHPSDTRDAPLDPNFEGYAVLASDSEGRYRFRTIKPGPYPDSSGRMRPSHIHFDVSGKINRTVTQLYFAGDPFLDGDPYLQSAGANKARLIVELLPGPTAPAQALQAAWDIVLDRG
ncbi:MAG TPA: protocatechuate 3,4-dioxygenase subunit beta [Luteimonas sp.]|nr:protocatechuate 3,4-dioxygenase subunit beta [Luteimonas sp.]